MRKVHPDLLAGVIGQLAVLAVLSRWAGLEAAGWLVGLGYGLVTVVLLGRGLERSRRRAPGPADRVTLLRSTLVGGVFALVVDGWSGPVSVSALVLLAFVALALDGVDGWVARRTRTASPLGARFDMEVDAFLILVLSVHVVGLLGPWVLAIGAARYLFVAATWCLPWMRASLPFRYWRKVVAATQGIALSLAATSSLPTPVVTVVVVGALALLAESFGRDVWWLWCRSRVPAWGAELGVASSAEPSGDRVRSAPVSPTGLGAVAPVSAVSPGAVRPAAAVSSGRV